MNIEFHLADKRGKSDMRSSRTAHVRLGVLTVEDLVVGTGVISP